jgi:hypothetical protein
MLFLNKCHERGTEYFHIPVKKYIYNIIKYKADINGMRPFCLILGPYPYNNL